MNPASGRGRSIGQRSRIERAFRRRGIPFRLLISGSESHLLELAAETAETAESLILVGGDTTFTLVAQELQSMKSNIKLGLVAAGSANDLVRALGCSKIDGLCQAVLNDSTRPIRVGELLVNEQKQRLTFLGTVSAGLGAIVNRAVAQYRPRFPNIMFLNGLNQWLPAVHSVRHAFSTNQVPRGVSIDCEDHSLSVDFSLLLFLNIPYYANGIRVSRRVNPFDDLLECQVWRTTSLSETVRAGIRNVMGGSGGKSVTRIRSNRFSISADPGFDIQYDGQPLTGVRTCTISLRPSTFSLYIP